ncbi:MAG TPA: LysE family translocator [Gammaproteobacteria bacterium]|nr:LysE family translocator [Gammaproteobacteria bacterium]
MNSEYLLTSLIVVLLPGSGVVYTLSIGLGRGWLASIFAAFGCTMGIIPAAAASIVGLAAILHTSALAFQVLKFLGVAYLLYMAWRILQDGGDLDVREEKSKTPLVKIAVNGMLLNILNPKLSLFFFAFLPQFVPSNVQNTSLTLLSLALVFMLLTFIVFAVYGVAASLARDYFIASPGVMNWFKRVFAGTFGFLGVKLAFSNS